MKALIAAYACTPLHFAKKGALATTRPESLAALAMSHRPLPVTGGGLLALGGLWQSFIPGLQPHYLTHWRPSQILTGIGLG